MAHAMAGHARPMTPLKKAAITDATRSRTGNSSRLRRQNRYATCSARVRANARPLGRVSDITAITGRSVQYRRCSSRYRAVTSSSRCIDSAYDTCRIGDSGATQNSTTENSAELPGITRCMSL